MKKLIILVVLVVAGYFAYQHFYLGSQEEYDMEDEPAVESEAYSYDGPSEPIPENCQLLATDLENAIYGNDKGQVSFAQKNSAYRKLQSCLRAEGFSGDQIGNAIAEIENRVQGYLAQDSGQ